MTVRLSIVHAESSLGWGGQEIRVLTEAQGFIRRGHRVTLLCPQEAEIFRAAPLLAVPAVPLPIARKNMAGLLALTRWFGANGGKVDVINTHSSTDSWLTALARPLAGMAAPMVRTRHVSSPIGTGRATRWLYMRATAHVVTTGEALRLQLHRDNGYPLSHMTSVPTGIDLSRFGPRSKADARHNLGLGDGPIIGIVATLRNWKGHTYLLDAFKTLRSTFPSLELVIVGDGPQRANLERRVRELGLEGAVRFTGNRDDVEQWLNAFDIFALPSYGDEGVPQALMQAMACGVPVISTPVGGIPEIVHHDVTGLLVPPHDSAALAAALGGLLRDAELRHRLGSAAQEFAQRECGIDRMLDRMEDVFLRTIEPGHR